MSHGYVAGRHRRTAVSAPIDPTTDWSGQHWSTSEAATHWCEGLGMSAGMTMTAAADYGWWRSTAVTI
jgi:hypothetical protein